MKRLLLFTLSTIFTLSMSAQTVTFSDDFESYNLGDYIGASSDVWTTWSGTNGEGTPLDALVTDEWAQSGDHSIEIRQTLLGTDDDVDVMLGMVEFQHDWDIAFDLLVPNGFGAYWNMQGAGSVGQTWAMDMFLEPDGTFIVSQGGVEFSSGTYSPDTWVSVVVHCDLDNDDAYVTVDGVDSNVMPFDLYIFGGINFYGGGVAGDVLYFVDNVVVTDMTPVNIDEVKSFDFEVYPTPASDVVNIVSNAQGTAQVTLVNLAGQQVYTEMFNSLTQRQINVSDLAEGLYFIQVASDNTYVTKKIMVKH